MRPSDVVSWQRSRQTRHQDAASRSRQGHVIDLDPTDGLPVQRWGLQKITINQDASTDPSSTNPKSTSSAEWAAQFNTEQHPWPEHPLPSYYHQLQPWNQELIRRARAGNTNATVSTYDRKTHSWISGADQERKAATAKLNSVNVTDSTEKPRNGNDAESPKSGDDSGAEDSSNEYNKSADEDEFDGDETTPFKPSSNKRRKVTSRHNGPDDTRTFEVKKWVPLPPSQADKAQDKTFLAPRRPGMPALYNPEYAQKMFGRYHSSASLTGTTGYDLGEGGGLSNASGVLAAGSTNDTGVATPRKNVPPRRKKKKLGGPGRKKANPTPLSADAGNSQISAAAGATGQGAGTDAMQGVTGDGGLDADTSGNTTRNPGYDGANDDGAGHDDDNDNDNENDSGSEAEGSEEGEIDETGGTGSGSAHATEIPPAVTITAPTTAASVHVEVTLPSTEPTELKPIDEAQDVASPSPSASASAPPPAAETTTATPPTTTTEPTTEPVAVTVATPPTDTLPTTSPAAEPTTLPPALEPNPTVTITDTEPEIDTAMPDVPTSKDPEETAIIEENAQAIIGTGATSTATEKGGDGNVGEGAAVSAGAGTDGEIDFLGGLDAAIDREVSEGA